MKINVIIILFTLVILNSSCLEKNKCNIKPMKSNIIDSTKLKGNLIFKSNLGIIDTLELIDYHNVLKNNSKKSLMTIEECEHSMGFDYYSTSNKGTINVCLKKNNKNKYNLSFTGFCISKDIIMNQKQVEKDSIFIIEVNECDRSEFKTLAFKKCRIEYFISKDEQKWELIKFIPLECIIR
jgi:hypothetical protein